MPDNDAINKAVANAKTALAKANSNWPKLPSSAPASSGDHTTAPYSMAREARDTGSSINYNLKQKQAASTALSDAGVK